jgi:hypothetical protein
MAANIYCMIRLGSLHFETSFPLPGRSSSLVFNFASSILSCKNSGSINISSGFTDGAETLAVAVALIPGP